LNCYVYCPILGHFRKQSLILIIFSLAPICLPEKNEVFLGKFGWAAGWGALNPGSRLRPKTLQAVDVPVIDNKVCERWHRANGINVVIYPEMLCAGYRNGKILKFSRKLTISFIRLLYRYFFSTSSFFSNLKPITCRLLIRVSFN
jgi:hypothetical protein